MDIFTVLGYNSSLFIKRMIHYMMASLYMIYNPSMSKQELYYFIRRKLLH